MTQTIVGSIKVHDNNGDGLINLDADTISFAYNDDRISPDSFSSDPGVQHALKTLGVDTLEGISISAAKEFMTGLVEAKQLASRGDVERVEEMVPGLLEMSQKNGFGLTERGARRIVRNALVSGIWENYEATARLVSKGDPECSHEPNRTRVLQYAQRLKEEFGFDVTEHIGERITYIDNMWFDKNPEIKRMAVANADAAARRYEEMREEQLEKARRNGEEAAKRAREHDKLMRPTRERDMRQARLNAHYAQARYFISGLTESNPLSNEDYMAVILRAKELIDREGPGIDSGGIKDMVKKALKEIGPSS